MSQAENKEIPKLFGDRLRWFRNQRGISQAELGKSVSRTATSISEWEKGDAEPSLGQISAMAEVLGVSPERLAFGVSAYQRVDEEQANYENGVLQKLMREGEAEFSRLQKAAANDAGQLGWIRQELRALYTRMRWQGNAATAQADADLDALMRESENATRAVPTREQRHA